MTGEAPGPGTGEDNRSDESSGLTPTSRNTGQANQGRLARISAWLTAGKDPIHVVSLLLGIVALFFTGYLQWQVAGIQQEVIRNQRELVTLQQEDLKRKHAPDIAIEIRRIPSPKTKAPERDELIIFAYGIIPIRDFHWNAYTFVRGCVPEDELTRREIHFMGYWDNQERTGNRMGEVARFQGGTNYKELCELTDRLRTLVKKPTIRPLATVTYIALWYRDRDNKPYANYFACESGDECLAIKCEDWQRACFAANAAMESGDTIIRGNVTPKELLERLRTVKPGDIRPSDACADCKKIKAMLQEP
jgi:hypothetical protein